VPWKGGEPGPGGAVDENFPCQAEAAVLGPGVRRVQNVNLADAPIAVPWHQPTAPAPGHRKARRGAQLVALLYVIATLIYVIAWDMREVGELCLARDDGPPCPPPPAEPTAWLSAARWVTWSVGALLILTALVFARRASDGRSTASSVWRSPVRRSEAACSSASSCSSDPESITCCVEAGGLAQTAGSCDHHRMSRRAYQTLAIVVVLLTVSVVVASVIWLNHLDPGNSH
jgi:hypothetical protein